MTTWYLADSKTSMGVGYVKMDTQTYDFLPVRANAAEASNKYRAVLVDSTEFWWKEIQSHDCR